MIKYRVEARVRRDHVREEWISTDCTLRDSISMIRDYLKRGFVVVAYPEANQNRGDLWEYLKKS